MATLAYANLEGDHIDPVLAVIEATLLTPHDNPDTKIEPDELRALAEAAKQKLKECYKLNADNWAPELFDTRVEKIKLEMKAGTRARELKQRVVEAEVHSTGESSFEGFREQDGSK